MEDQQQQQSGFRTFEGVFRPVALTILGAMLYLREGWLVGNAGLLGALAVIFTGYAITGTTAMSLSSISTNVRVKPGGAFAIISQSLGLEAGGAIGIPLYVAQAASVAMYLYAFTEAVQFLAPSLPAGWVAFGAFVAVTALAYLSADLAFKAQAVMMGVVGLALLSVLGGLFSAEQLHSPVWVGRFEDASLVRTFNIFFPACTGIMVGVGMSGSLANPRKSIPNGTLWAWGVTLTVYVLGALWYSVISSPDELLHNKLAMIEHSLFGPLVLFGLISSTLMAALSSMVAAPQLLAAMAEHGVTPMSGWLSRKTEEGQHRNAVIATAALSGVGLLSGSLDAIAPIITSAFLLTYLALNATVLMEQRLQMISFRPTFRIPSTLSVAGVVLCAVALYFASPKGGVVEVGSIILLYLYLVGKKLDTPWETARSGIAVNIAAWAANRAVGMRRTERSWQPDLLVPVQSASQPGELLPLVRRLSERSGSVKFVGYGDDPDLANALQSVVKRISSRRIFSTWSVMEEAPFAQGVRYTLDALQGHLFPPNLLVLDGANTTQEELDAIVERCRDRAVGVLLVMRNREQLSIAGAVNVWVSERTGDWEVAMRLQNLDLPVLTAYLLTQGEGPLRLLTALRDPKDKPAAEHFLEDLKAMARLPRSTEYQIYEGSFLHALERSPECGMHLFGMPPEPDLQALQRIYHKAGAPCAFLLDSGRESLLA